MTLTNIINLIYLILYWKLKVNPMELCLRFLKMMMVNFKMYLKAAIVYANCEVNLSLH